MGRVEAVAERCGDGLDNDCDGQTDEGCLCRDLCLPDGMDTGGFCGCGHQPDLAQCNRMPGCVRYARANLCTSGGLDRNAVCEG